MLRGDTVLGVVWQGGMLLDGHVRGDADCWCDFQGRVNCEQVARVDVGLCCLGVISERIGEVLEDLYLSGWQV